MKPSPTVSALHFKRHIDTYQKLYGEFDYDYFQHRHGVSELRLSQPDYRVPLAAATDFFLLCAERSNDPCFGLTWANKAPYNFNGQIVRSLAAVPDVRTFFQQNIRMSRLTSEVASFDIAPYDEQHELLRMNLTDAAPTCRHQVDGGLSYIIRATRFILKSRFPDTKQYADDFTAVLFEHECPPGMEQTYQQHFGVPVRFNQPANGLLMVKEWLNVRLLKGQTSISDVVACCAEGLRLNGQHSFTEITAQCIEHLLPHGAPSRERIASAMNISLRTLQRYLKEEGQSFQGILESIRKRLAQEYIERNCYPLEEVAFLLGYSNITAFYAAYRRWFRATPRGNAATGQSERESRSDQI